MINIRNYKKNEYELVSSWWKKHINTSPLNEMIPEESSFILEKDGVPCFCITGLLTNSSDVCFLENFVSNPDITDKVLKKELSTMLVNHMYSFLSSLGYTRVICFSDKESLNKRYLELGMTRGLDNYTSFMRIL